MAYFKKAKDLDPNLELNPENEAQNWAAKGLIKKGLDLAKQGKVKEGINKYSEAMKLDPTIQISARDWNYLCWNRLVWGYVSENMVGDACEKTAAIDPKHGFYIDSRGVYRALTGDYAGAVEDFEYYIKWAPINEEPAHFNATRKKWVSQLKADKNPIDQSTLIDLRTE